MKRLAPILAVPSIESSVAFYTDVLGFSVTFTAPGDDGKLVHAVLKRGEVDLMLGRLDAASEDRRDVLGTGVVLYMAVDDDEDLDAYFERVKAAGATITQEPTDQFWDMRDWGIADPDGYLIVVGQNLRKPALAEQPEEALAPA